MQNVLSTNIFRKQTPNEQRRQNDVGIRPLFAKVYGDDWKNKLQFYSILTRRRLATGIMAYRGSLLFKIIRPKVQSVNNDVELSYINCEPTPATSV